MRITRDLLLKYAKESAAKMASKDRGMVCIYLTGSLLKTDPFIGGITDIDLVCVHDRPIKIKREIIRIAPDIHLDVAHYLQEDFLPARKLRTDAWIGGALDNGTILLQDSSHWFDLIRSTAISQYWQSANVAARSGVFVASARQKWTTLSEGGIPQGIKRVQALLDAIRDTANATACISGMPLPVRRLFLDIPGAAAQAGIPEVAGELVQLFANEEVLDESWNLWLAEWANAFDSLQEQPEIPAAIHPLRRGYYEKAVEQLTGDRPAAALWILLYTWTKIAAVLPKSDPSYKEWQNLCKQLQLDSKNIPQRLDALDTVLERVEEIIDTMQA